VAFSRQVSDGNYGSETVRCELDIEADEGETLGSADIISRLEATRTLVERELKRSGNRNVQIAVRDVNQVNVTYEQPELEETPA
jgi:hypothetical protein